MQYGFLVTGGDPRGQADLAAEAEAAGWDGVFTYDAIDIGGMEMHDPWIVLAAMAMRTERVRLGALIFAPTRRRPWKLAREALTLDHLSHGRIVLPVGLGALDDRGFGAAGETTDTRERAAILDETLQILAALWSGEPVRHQGARYRIDGMTFRPLPVQRPRIPIWVVGAWPAARSMRRAARWDGVVLQPRDQDAWRADGAEIVREAAGWIAVERARAGQGGAFDIVVDGTTSPGNAADAERVAALADAGATWWIESDWNASSLEATRERIAAGPPRAT